MGHEAVAVLDGGFAKWTAEELPTARGEESRPPRAFRGAPVAGMVVNANEVAALARRSDWRLVDARAPERYRGEIEPIDRVAGHIPGAVNHFFKRNLANDGTFLMPEPLRARLRQATNDVAPDHIVCYCGSGVTACQNLLALEHAGLGGAKLYPGSWSEWSSRSGEDRSRRAPSLKLRKACRYRNRWTGKRISSRPRAGTGVTGASAENSVRNGGDSAGEW